ncbi:hypothetical protein CsSME_00032404 [Camellia sinensis var. sinensis]
MGVIELNRRLKINLGIPAIRHCYALAKSSGRLGRYFLRAKDTDHHLITMLVSSGKRVDDVMVNVRGNWEFGEGEDCLDPIPRRKGHPGCHVTPRRAAHILLRYEPTYTTFSAADSIPIASGDQHLSALLFPSFKSLRQIGLEDSDSGEDAEPTVEVVAEPTREVAEEAEEVDEAIRLAFEATGLNQPSLSTSGRAEFSSGDIFTNLGDLPGNFFEETAQVAAAETGKEVEQQVIDERLIPEERGKNRSAEGETRSEISPASKQPRLEESMWLLILLFGQRYADLF